MNISLLWHGNTNRLKQHGDTSKQKGLGIRALERRLLKGIYLYLNLVTSRQLLKYLLRALLLLVTSLFTSKKPNQLIRLFQLFQFIFILLYLLFSYVIVTIELYLYIALKVVAQAAGLQPNQALLPFSFTYLIKVFSIAFTIVAIQATLLLTNL